jgi:hypothetical protein
VNTYELDPRRGPDRQSRYFYHRQFFGFGFHFFRPYFGFRITASPQSSGDRRPSRRRIAKLSPANLRLEIHVGRGGGHRRFERRTIVDRSHWKIFTSPHPQTDSGSACWLADVCKLCKQAMITQQPGQSQRARYRTNACHQSIKRARPTPHLRSARESGVSGSRWRARSRWRWRPPSR